LPTAADVPVAAAVAQDPAGQPVDMARLAVAEQLADVMAAEPRLPGTGLALGSCTIIHAEKSLQE
jgi:hypothetical protein